MSYVPDPPSDRRIIEERLLYLPMVRALEDAMFPELAQTAKKMVKVLDYIVGYMTFEDIVLDRFLGHASALRKTLQRTQQKIDTSKWSYPDGTQINPASRNEVRSMISSSEELRVRGRDLLRAIGLVKKRAKGLRRPKGSRSYRLSSSIFRTKEDGNTILGDMADMVEVAQAAFETRASIDIVECIANIVNCQQRKDQFQVAEEFARFIERVTSGAGSAHSADQAQRCSAEAIPMEQNIAIDMERWLSSEKRVYCLSGEPGTGKTRIATGLCGLLSSELASRATLGASFFISHGNKDLRSFRFALLSISHQVSPRSRANLLGIVREHLYRGEEEQLRNVAIELLHKSLAAASPFVSTPTVLVLDGVDQSEESDNIPGLLRHLFSFLSEFPWLFIFLSTRPRPNVMAALTHPSVAELVHHHQLEDDVGRWNGDSGLYLKYTVPTIPAYNYLQRSSGDLLRLVQLVGSNFLFAQLAARYLDAAAAHERPEARLRRLLSMATAKSPLETLYMQQLESAASVPSADQHTCLRTLLRFIAQTGCGLTPDEISTYAHGVSADDVAIIVDDLRAVLTIKCDGEIVPHDASFSQFLLDMRAVDRLPPCLLF